MKKIKDSIIIGNCCDSTYIKEFYISDKLDHPRYSSCMIAEDYLKFIKTFNNIDFSSYKKLCYNDSKISNRKHIYSWNGHNRKIGIKTEDTITIEYDNGIQIIYPHYVDWKEFDNKYNRRLERFYNANKEDIIFTVRIYRDYTDNIIDEIYNLPVNKILIFPSNHILKNNYKENKNTKIIITDTWHYNFVNFIKEYDK